MLYPLHTSCQPILRPSFIVCTPSLFCRSWGAGVGVESLTKFSKRGGLSGSQFLEGGYWERGGDFFQGGCSFNIKNKLKSEIFNDKKVYKQKCFSVIIKCKLRFFNYEFSYS